MYRTYLLDRPKQCKVDGLLKRRILDAQKHHSSVDLYTLGWVPYYVESDIKRCLIAYKRISGACPDHD